jgi:hypothetical protein
MKWGASTGLPIPPHTDARKPPAKPGCSIDLDGASTGPKPPRSEAPGEAVALLDSPIK